MHLLRFCKYLTRFPKKAQCPSYSSLGSLRSWRSWPAKDARIAFAGAEVHGSDLVVEIVPAVSFIGVITFCLSFLGVKVGNVFGARYKSKAELCGGIILIGMGVKILIEHLFF